MNKYVRPFSLRTTYIACCPLVSHSEHANGTDGEGRLEESKQCKVARICKNSLVGISGKWLRW